MRNEKVCILIADDDKEIRDFLQILLRGEGYETLTASDGEEAIANASSDIDLYILDVNMPGLSGFAVASQIRQEYDAPIIFLTAYSAETDKIMGFSAGADDYIVKPFSNMELLMRVRAILRRSVRETQKEVAVEKVNQIKIQDLVLDLDQQSVVKQGEIVSLTYTEYKILELLATNRKKIFSMENIYQSIWDDAVGDSAIMVHIKNLRKKIGDDSRNPKYIKTAWGKGYYVE